MRDKKVVEKTSVVVFVVEEAGSFGSAAGVEVAVRFPGAFAGVVYMAESPSWACPGSPRTAGT